MIILPVKIFDLHKNSNIIQDNTIQNSPAYITKPYCQDKLELSFTGFFENATEPVRLDQAKEISGIHCPVCGIQMLSEKTYENILKKAENADNAQDFVNILKENQEYIPKHLKRIIKDSQNIENLEGMSIKDYYSEMNLRSYLSKQVIIHKIRDDLKEYANWLKLPQEQNEKAHEIVDKIHTKQKYSTFSSFIDEYIKFLNLHDDAANQIKIKTLKPVVQANDYYLLFHVLKSSEMTDKEISHNIARYIFTKSVNTEIPMDHIPNHKGLPNNKVLICKNCDIMQCKNHFLHDTGNPKLKSYMNSYLADIAYLIGHNKMEQSKEYIPSFCYNVTRITRGKIFFTEQEIKSLKNLQHSASRHEIFAPIQQSKTDIPCADCGSVLLTHEMRKHIEDEMRDCKNIQDYSNLLNKYDKYVGSYAKPYVNMFQSTIKDNPDISKEEFIEIFQRKADRFAERRFKKALEEYKQHRQYYVTHGTPEQLKNYDIFKINVNEYIKSKAYLDNELITYYNKCIQPLNLDNAPVKAIYEFTTKAKQIIYIRLH